MRCSPSTTWPRLTNCAELPRCRRRLAWACGVLLAGIATPAMADEEFTLDLEEFAKKPCSLSGYAEIQGERLALREDGTANLLRGAEPSSTLRRLSSALQLSGTCSLEITSLTWQAAGFAGQDNFGWADSADLYQGYLSVSPNPATTAAVGKKAYTWGKGYAWNPVGFLNRSKDPNNPDEALEGYVTAEAEWIKSLPGDLQNIALTSVILPVEEGLNDEFGSQSRLNFAAKLYLLYRDTDIDLIVAADKSRANCFGIDFSRNLTTNFEIHGEVAHFLEITRAVLEEDGKIALESGERSSALFGIRHLSRNNLTSIIEYYHNGAGYSAAELSLFHEQVDAAAGRVLESGDSRPLDALTEIGRKGYSRPYAGKNYLYARFSLKEPLDILYFTPALTAIVNLDDGSYALTPELSFSGFTNWQIRLRLALLKGDEGSDYGERASSNRVELRIRYFF
jgi:hypothetical protein